MKTTIYLLLAFSIMALRADPVTDPEGHFSAIFPGSAVKKSQQADVPGGKTITSATVCVSGKTVFVVRYSDLPGEESSQASAADMYQGAIQQSVRAVNGVLRSQSPCKVDNIEGVEYIVDASNPTDVIRSKLFLVGSRLFQITYIGPTGSENDKPVADFLDSFKLLH